MISTEPDSYKQIVLIIRISLCVLCWTAMAVRMWLNWLLVIDGGTPIEVYGNAFSYYTTQTNLIVAVWVTIAVVYHKNDEKPFILSPSIHGAITGYISITFIIFALLLSAYYQPTGIEAFTNISMHYIIPIMFIIDWFISECDVQYQYSWLIYWLIYPFIYLAYSVIRGYITGFYPYYFIDLNHITVYDLILFTIALTIFYLLITSIYITLNRKIYSKRNE